MTTAHTSDDAPPPDAGPPAVDTQAAVAELRATRRRRRLGDADWGELAYRVYTTAFFCLVVTIMLSGWVGDSPVDDAAAERAAAEGPAWAGLALAVAVLLAVRSGSRGGPISLEAPDVHNLLLAPTPRTATLRRPTAGVLGYGVATGVAVVAIVGSLMSQRLPGGGAAWVGAGALFGGVLATAALGSALLTCSRTTPRMVPLAVAWALLAWAVADVASDAPAAPTTYAGEILFLPLASGPAGLGWVAVALLAAGAGAALIGGLSIEAARKRTMLVGQLRFAVTQQDLRTVVLLRRQLASEVPRNRPWFRVPRAVARRFPVTARDLASVAHWPPIRLVRVLVLAVGAALAARAMWSGTTPMILVAGIATFVAALDVTEPLSQEVDHPTLTESLPVPAGRLYQRHLVAPCIAMVVAGLVALAVAYAVDPAPEVLSIGAVTLVTASGTAVAAATISIVSSVHAGGGDLLMTPEVAGPRLVFRTAWPPLVAMSGFAPAFAASRAGGDVESTSVALGVAVPVLVLVAIVFGWVRFRSDIHQSIAAATGGGTTG